MSCVTVQKSAPIRTVTFDNGPKNPLNLDAVMALREALAPDPEAPVAILRGRADGFCVGLDNAVLAGSRVAREELLGAMGELLLETLRNPTRIVAVCEGHAVAAGAMLLLVSDVRIGLRATYKVGFTEPRLGMPLPELPALLARMRLDRRWLHALTALGEVVDAERALEVGFLDQLVNAEELTRSAVARAGQIASLSDAAYRGSHDAVWGREMEHIAMLVAQQRARRDAVRSSGG